MCLYIVFLNGSIWIELMLIEQQDDVFGLNFSQSL